MAATNSNILNVNTVQSLTIAHRSLMTHSPKISALPVKAYRRTFNFLKAIFSQLFHSSCDLELKPFIDYKLDAQADVSTKKLLSAILIAHTKNEVT